MRYIGCKTLLIPEIETVINRHVKNADVFCDIFSGTAVVSRHFKKHYEVISNDLLYFSYCLGRGTVENDEVQIYKKLSDSLGIKDPLQYFSDVGNKEVETLPKEKRFFQNNYAPTGGRMYLTDENALRFDFARNTVEEWRNNGLLNDDEYFYLVACIVEGIPFVSNIKGTYGAFSKSWDKRSFKVYEPYRLEVNSNGKANRCFNEDGIELLKQIEGDILYIDPPYNSRQYLPNYHVLETAALYDSPELHGVTGLRNYDEQKSDFCSKNKVESAFARLIENAKFQHIIFSYNTDGLMTAQKIEEIMKSYGDSHTFELTKIPYRRYKSRHETQLDGLCELIFYIKKKV